MALITKLDFNGVKIPAAYIKVIRVFGGKIEGWNSVVAVYASKDVADVDGEPLEKFNQPAAYLSENMNPLELVYSALKEKYPNAKDK